MLLFGLPPTKDEAASWLDRPDGPVHEALFLLAGHNVFGKSFFFGPFNGKFGAAAGTASKNAKFFLGYPEAQLAPTFGQRLDDYLLGKRKQTQVMLARQAKRGFVSPRTFVYPAVRVDTYSTFASDSWARVHTICAQISESTGAGWLPTPLRSTINV